MPFYATPGVYVEEVPSGTHPISAVGTSTAAFLGTAPDPTARLDDAVPINTWSDFLRIYVGEGASVDEPNVLAAAVFGFFNEGGGRCYVVNMEPNAPLAGAGRQRKGLRLLEPIDEIAIVAAPGRNAPADWSALISHCENLEDRVCILDTVPRVDDVEKLTRVHEETPGPDDSPSNPSRGKGSSSSSSGGDAAPADAAGGDDAAARAGGDDDEGARPPQSNYAAAYFPWIYVQHPLNGKQVEVPPSGHMAGIWARTDTSRGVHKAPANEGVRSAIGLTQALTREEQSVINPAGINAIRSFPGAGILVWGARTLDEEASPFRYLNVRRLFNMLKESIGDNTRWIVFEPNDYMLWRSIVRDVSAFLTLVWRDGALFGRTPQEAFFVKCDAETNPPEERDAGRVVCLIGVAPVKPAEFVVFKLSQTSGGAEIETIGGWTMSDATATPAAQPGTWVDPYRAYTFNLLIKNVDAGHFTEVRGLGVQIDRIAYQEAGLNSIERMVPGRVRFSPVELCYGVTDSDALWKWLDEVRNGQVRREEVSIAVLDSTGTAEVMRWNLARAWPCEWRGALLSTSSTELAIETLVLAHEGITRDHSGGAPTAAPAPAPAGGSAPPPGGRPDPLGRRGRSRASRTPGRAPAGGTARALARAGARACSGAVGGWRAGLLAGPRAERLAPGAGRCDGRPSARTAPARPGAARGRAGRGGGDVRRRTAGRDRSRRVVRRRCGAASGPDPPVAAGDRPPPTPFRARRPGAADRPGLGRAGRPRGRRSGVVRGARPGVPRRIHAAPGTGRRGAGGRESGRTATRVRARAGRSRASARRARAARRQPRRPRGARRPAARRAPGVAVADGRAGGEPRCRRRLRRPPARAGAGAGGAVPRPGGRAAAVLRPRRRAREGRAVAHPAARARQGPAPQRGELTAADGRWPDLPDDRELRAFDAAAAAPDRDRLARLAQEQRGYD